MTNNKAKYFMIKTQTALPYYYLVELADSADTRLSYSR